MQNYFSKTKRHAPHPCGKATRPKDGINALGDHAVTYPCDKVDNFTVIAHRGASAYFPENTLVAFEGAIDLGADMVELDVQLTSDGEVVVFHDEKIGRCTKGGRGRVVEYSLSTLKSLDAGSWFDRKFTGQRIPTLAEVLSLCKDRVAVNIEIKSCAVTQHVLGGIEEKCLQMVDRAGMRGHVICSSFDPRALVHLKAIDRFVPVAVLYEKRLYDHRLPSEIVELLDAEAFNCKTTELTRARLEDLKKSNIPVNVYTVNDEDKMRRLLSQGVSGIFTNCPDVLRAVVEEIRCNRKNSKS